MRAFLIRAISSPKVIASVGTVATGYIAYSLMRQKHTPTSIESIRIDPILSPTLARNDNSFLFAESKNTEISIIIRIWYSKDENVGHASIQIKDDYLSFWPKYAISLTEKPGIISFCEATLLSLENDIDAEGQIPDRVYQLIGLDVSNGSKMLNHIKNQVKQGTIGYCLTGTKLKGSVYCLNCSTTVFKVLKASGFNNDSFLRETTSALISPNELSNIIDDSLIKAENGVKNRLTNAK